MASGPIPNLSLKRHGYCMIFIIMIMKIPYSLIDDHAGSAKRGTCHAECQAKLTGHERFQPMPLKIREILGEIHNKEVIARGASVKILKRLEKQYGRGNWIKMKGDSNVRLSDGSIKRAEIHWFEAHGIGKKNIKVKYYLGE